jgi:hypothetical protein
MLMPKLFTDVGLLMHFDVDRLREVDCAAAPVAAEQYA